jgi:hypothetical protein
MSRLVHKGEADLGELKTDGRRCARARDGNVTKVGTEATIEDSVSASCQEQQHKQRTHQKRFRNSGEFIRNYICMSNMCSFSYVCVIQYLVPLRDSTPYAMNAK